MSKKVLIASDSTCDLSPELIEKYEIKILPLRVTLGENEYFDGVDIDTEMIYSHYERCGELPKTAAVNIAEFSSFFEKHVNEGYSIVLFTLSSSMSSTYNNAKLASEDFDDVYVVDTKNLSTGGGLLVLTACEMAREGADACSIAEECGRLAKKVDASFVIDNLEFLYKGGRCSAVERLGASVLQLKPCIVVKDGTMGVGKKYRGKFAVELQKYIADRIGDASDIDTSRIFVTHAGCDSAIIDACVEQVKSMGVFKEVLVTRAGCTISSHCGRNTLGVLFIRKNEIV
ncbi:MAG: DegV family protein [Clostridia bacterium]|nr:DegV family protein [Clostridia bacterium]